METVSEGHLEGPKQKRRYLEVWGPLPMILNLTWRFLSAQSLRCQEHQSHKWWFLGAHAEPEIDLGISCIYGMCFTPLSYIHCLPMNDGIQDGEIQIHIH